jgi:hypothetical protein
MVEMGRMQVGLGMLLVAPLLAATLGCDALKSDNDASDDDSAEDDGASKKKKKKKKKKKNDDDGDKLDENLDISAAFGESAAFGGTFDMYGQAFFGATSHSPIEPSNFSAGWVGRESHDVLQNARKKLYRHSQVRMASRRLCLVFKDGNTVRRAMIATRRDAPTEELAFAQNGNLILWYRHNRSKPTFEDWAYFHRGNNLMLYQTRSRGGARETEAASADLRAHILRGAKECIQASSATNPLPGAAPAPTPTPTPVTPGGGNGSQPSAAHLHFGALAFSESASAWRVSYRKGNAEEAKKEALGGCKQADCKIRATFDKGQCISVIHGPPPLVTWGWANDNNAAQANATKQCTDRGHAAASCNIQGTWCNDG